MARESKHYGFPDRVTPSFAIEFPTGTQSKGVSLAHRSSCRRNSALYVLSRPRIRFIEGTRKALEAIYSEQKRLNCWLYIDGEKNGLASSSACRKRKDC